MLFSFYPIPKKTFRRIFKNMKPKLLKEHSALAAIYIQRFVLPSAALALPDVDRSSKKVDTRCT